MAGDSKIQWTQKTWNPVAGCSVVSPGCTNCYAMKMAARIEAMARGAGRTSAYDGLTRQTKAGAVWTGELRAVESAMTQPLRWKKPALIFVNSMSDLFHEAVPDPVIDQVFAVMALSPHHTFQVLTKRAERMRAYCNDPATPGRIARVIVDMLLDKAIRLGMDWPVRTVGDIDDPDDITIAWPLPNVWKGVSAEDQARADERTPHLLATPAAVRFLSAEPLLGAIDLTKLQSPPPRGGEDDTWATDAMKGRTAPIIMLGAGLWELDGGGRSGPRLDWVIVGGESGPGARPMHPDWARQIRDACAAAGVPFFFKQWGAWAEVGHLEDGPAVTEVEVGGETSDAYYAIADGRARAFVNLDGRAFHGHPDNLPEGRWRFVERIGKKATGRLLDGIEHNAMPGGAA
ncbi:MAG: phage Gp37/Gp68 family protein [Moraxellaceae bacterium]